MRKVLVITKRGCHLCEMVTGALESLSSKHQFEMQVVDITDDIESFGRYALRIPLVRLDGREVFEARDVSTPEECRSALDRLLS